MARKNKKSKSLFLIIVFIFLLGFLVFHFLSTVQKLNEAHQSFKSSPKITQKQVIAPKDKIAILIDDLGSNLEDFKKVKALDPNISFAILPFQPFSIKIAKDAHLVHHDVLLHLPMEPEKYENPGPGAIYDSMSKEEILKQTRKDLLAFPYIQGVNNHMGSKITSDQEEMKLILREIKSKNIFFIDSRTTSKSVAYKMAKEMGLKTEERQIFLDDNNHFQNILNELENLIEMSHRRGYAIAIGHPRKNTIKALQIFLPGLEKQGIEVVPISTLVK